MNRRRRNSPAKPTNSPAPTARIRRARSTDLPGILRAEESSFTLPGDAFSERRIHALIANPRAIVLVAENAGRIFGWACGLIRRHPAAGQNIRISGRVYSLAVHPDARGMRLGARLLQKVIDELIGRGVARIFLEVESNNQRAIELYRKFGFADAGMLAHYYGRRRHALRMLRTITRPHQRPLRQIAL